MLAFGSEGGKRLQAMIDQRQDRRLAELAWQVLYIRQGMENFCPLVEPEKEAARIAATNPLLGGQTTIAPGRAYSPLERSDEILVIVTYLFISHARSSASHSSIAWFKAFRAPSRSLVRRASSME